VRSSGILYQIEERHLPGHLTSNRPLSPCSQVHCTGVDEFLWLCIKWRTLSNTYPDDWRPAFTPSKVPHRPFVLLLLSTPAVTMFAQEQPDFCRCLARVQHEVRARPSGPVQ